MYNFPIQHIHSCYQRERNTSVMDVIPIKPTNLQNISLDLLFQIIKIPCHNAGYLHGQTIFTQLHHVLKKTHFDDYSQLQKRQEKPTIKCESEFPINPLTGVTQECKKKLLGKSILQKIVFNLSTKTNLNFHLYICWSTSGSQIALASSMLPPSSTFFKADLTTWGKHLKLVIKKLKV